MDLYAIRNIVLICFISIQVEDRHVDLVSLYRHESQWFSIHLIVGARCSSVVRAFMGHRIDPSWNGHIELFLVPHWFNKGLGVCHPVCGMMHIKEPLLLIGKSSLCGSSRFPLSLSEWSFTICPMPYNRK